MIRITAICLLLYASTLTMRAAFGAPTTQPVKVQIDDVSTLLSDLESIDPSTRDGAREQLMMLNASLLPQLRETVEKLDSISIAQSLALKDIVIHIRATGEHNFDGEGTSLIGVTQSGEPDAPCVIESRRIGFDAYRVLRDGDQIVQVALVDPRDGAIVRARAIEWFTQMQDWMRGVPVGSWIQVSVIRNGAQLSLQLRTAPNPDRRNGDLTPNYDAWVNEALDYWTREFEPVVSERSKRR